MKKILMTRANAMCLADTGISWNWIFVGSPKFCLCSGCRRYGVRDFRWDRCIAGVEGNSN